jgi:ribosomal protein S18 acetylase RimI-like enzyme
MNNEDLVLRKTTLADIPAMMEIFYQGQASLKALGVNQWQNNYPNADVVGKDIENGTAHVLTENGSVIATATIIFNHEPTYDQIYEGEWLSRGEFVVVHRVAVDNSYRMKGIASHILMEVEKMAIQANIPSLKIDTHKDNFPMRKTLEKNGFTYCGRIVLLDGNSRVAYEKLLI